MRRCAWLIQKLTLGVLLACGPVSAAESVPVPSDVARLLAQVHDEADPARAAAALVAYRGTPHALLAVALGNARLRQADLVTGAPRVALAGDARTAFNEALRLDPQLAAARLGLAYAAARAEDWPAAVTACAAAIAPGEAAVADLALYIDCAARAGDSRLAANLVAQAIVRHPAEGVFRRQELALLIAAERWEEAGAAVAAVLATDPADAAAWRSSAGIAARSRDADASRIGLEAALLLQPQDGDLRRQLATAQLAAGQAPAALATIRPVMNGSGPYASELVELAARAAYDADQSEQARTWLALPTTTPLGRGARLLQARLALQHGDLPAAQQALEVLLSAGELDPAVLTWAGSLAERAGDAPRAESLYRQAHAVAIGPATLRLALLLRQRHRDDEARTILAQYRQARPNDPDLPALEAALKAR